MLQRPAPSLNTAGGGGAGGGQSGDWEDEEPGTKKQIDREVG